MTVTLRTSFKFTGMVLHVLDSLHSDEAARWKWTEQVEEFSAHYMRSCFLIEMLSLNRPFVNVHKNRLQSDGEKYLYIEWIVTPYFIKHPAGFLFTVAMLHGSSTYDIRSLRMSWGSNGPPSHLHQTLLWLCNTYHCMVCQKMCSRLHVLDASMLVLAVFGCSRSRISPPPACMTQ